MKSLVLCPYLPDAADSGGAIRSRVLLAALARLGPVCIGAPMPADGAAAAKSRTERLAADLGVVTTLLPAAPEASPSPWRKLACWLRGRSEVLQRRWSGLSAGAAGQVLEAEAPDLLVVDSSHALPILPEQSPPLLLHLHNIESALLARRDGVRRSSGERFVRAAEAALMARAEASAARRARLSITVSELDRERLLSLCADAEAEAVPNTVDVEALPPLPPSEAASPLLLYVGDFDYPPNCEAAEELLLRHLPVLRAAHPDVSVRLVGRDSRGAVARIAAAHGAEATGRVEELAPHYREAAAVYLPIRSGGGTRIKVLEAFAVGRPVLSTAVGVEGLDVEPGVHYFAVEQPDDGVRALGAVLSGGGEEITRAARQRVVERWSHAAAIERIAALVGGLGLSAS